MTALPTDVSHLCYHDDEAARVMFEAIRWPDGPYCPTCGVFDTVSALGGESMGAGWYWCNKCREKFTVRVGSVLQRSHIPLHKWLIAFREMASSKKGVSAHQLHRTLGIAYKSAWFMAYRIREAMADDSPTPLGGEGKVVEIDETLIMKQRGRDMWEFSREEGWTKHGDRREVIVFALVERGGRARAMPIDNRTIPELRSKLKQHADTMSVLMTDEWQAYLLAAREFANHETVNHSEEEWTRGPVHTQTVENFFSVFKRGMKGDYQHCSEEHVARYLHEFAFPLLESR